MSISNELSDELAGLFSKGFLDDRMVADIVSVVRKHDAAQAELSALREELARKDVVIEDMLQSNSDMTTCLAAAEQRNAASSAVIEDLSEEVAQIKETLEGEQLKNSELIGLLRDARWRIVNKVTTTDDYKRLDKPVVERIDAALNPTESGASE